VNLGLPARNLAHGELVSAAEARAAGKRNTIVATAIGRELAGFVWAIGQEVRADRRTCGTGLK
jgi:hypothetical protein